MSLSSQMSVNYCVLLVCSDCAQMHVMYCFIKFQAFPLDMSQYGSLFNTTRIPKINKDSLFQNESAKHMVVMKGGNFYIFDVLDRDGKLATSSMAKMNFL